VKKQRSSKPTFSVDSDTPPPQVRVGNGRDHSTSQAFDSVVRGEASCVKKSGQIGEVRWL